MKTAGPFQSKYEEKTILEQMLVLPIFPLFDLSVMMFSVRRNCVSACNWAYVHKIFEYNFCIVLKNRPNLEKPPIRTLYPSHSVLTVLVLTHA